MRKKRDSEKQSVFVGDVFQTKNYGTIEVMEYVDSLNCTVKFKDGTSVNCQPHDAKRGSVKNPMAPRVRGVGFLGVGSARTKIGDITQKDYTVWYSMLDRCYGKVTAKNLSYGGVVVCDEWHNFQNFSFWYKSQMGAYKDDWHLDKDLLFKGCREYRPSTTRLVPKEVNAFLILRQADRGAWPIGVVLHNGKFYSQISSSSVQKIIGVYATPQEAFMAYKVAKEYEAQRLAEKYKGEVCEDVYSALCNFTVDEGD